MIAKMVALEFRVLIL